MNFIEILTEEIHLMYPKSRWGYSISSSEYDVYEVNCSAPYRKVLNDYLEQTMSNSFVISLEDVFVQTSSINSVHVPGIGEINFKFNRSQGYEIRRIRKAGDYPLKSPFETTKQSL
jgi:hypothetical protein